MIEPAPGRTEWTRFRAFGLNIYSELALPELEQAEGVADVCIRYGRTPSSLPDATLTNAHCQIARNQLLLHIAGVARYFVSDGTTILIEPAADGSSEALKLYLLGTAFGALLMQRGILPIHGSAIALNGRGIIFTGASGAGKSSLLAAFCERGATFVTDDVAAITVDDQSTRLHPGYPQKKLWNDSADHLGIDIRHSARVRTDLDKYAIGSTQGFCRHAIPLHSICELQPGASSRVTLSPLQSTDKLMVFMHNTFRPWLVYGLGLKAVHFAQCAALSRQVMSWRMQRPQGVFSLAEQMHLVEEQLALNPK